MVVCKCSRWNTFFFAVEAFEKMNNKRKTDKKLAFILQRQSLRFVHLAKYIHTHHSVVVTYGIEFPTTERKTKKNSTKKNLYICENIYIWMTNKKLLWKHEEKVKKKEKRRQNSPLDPESITFIVFGWFIHLELSSLDFQIAIHTAMDWYTTRTMLTFENEINERYEKYLKITFRQKLSIQKS